MSKELTLYLFYFIGLKSANLLVVLKEWSKIDVFSLYLYTSITWLPLRFFTTFFVSGNTSLLVSIIGY